MAPMESWHAVAPPNWVASAHDTSGVRPGGDERSYDRRRTADRWTHPMGSSRLTSSHVAPPVALDAGALDAEIVGVGGAADGDEEVAPLDARGLRDDDDA